MGGGLNACINNDGIASAVIMGNSYYSNWYLLNVNTNSTLRSASSYYTDEKSGYGAACCYYQDNILLFFGGRASNVFVYNYQTYKDSGSISYTKKAALPETNIKGVIYYTKNNMVYMFTAGNIYKYDYSADRFTNVSSNNEITSILRIANVIIEDMIFYVDQDYYMWGYNPLQNTHTKFGKLALDTSLFAVYENDGKYYVFCFNDSSEYYVQEFGTRTDLMPDNDVICINGTEYTTSLMSNIPYKYKMAYITEGKELVPNVNVYNGDRRKLDKNKLNKLL